MKVTNNPNGKEYNMTGPNVTPPPPGGAPKPERKFYQKKRFIIPGAFAALVTIIVASGGGAEDAPATTEAPAVTVEIDEPVVVETTEAPVPETTEAPAPETTTVAPAPETTEAPEKAHPYVDFDDATMRLFWITEDSELFNKDLEDLRAEAQVLCGLAADSADFDAYNEAMLNYWLIGPIEMNELFDWDL